MFDWLFPKRKSPLELALIEAAKERGRWLFEGYTSAIGYSKTVYVDMVTESKYVETHFGMGDSVTFIDNVKMPQKFINVFKYEREQERIEKERREYKVLVDKLEQKYLGGNKHE